MRVISPKVIFWCRGIVLELAGSLAALLPAPEVLIGARLCRVYAGGHRPILVAGRVSEKQSPP